MSRWRLRRDFSEDWIDGEEPFEKGVEVMPVSEYEALREAATMVAAIWNAEHEGRTEQSEAVAPAIHNLTRVLAREES